MMLNYGNAIIILLRQNVNKDNIEVDCLTSVVSKKLLWLLKRNSARLARVRRKAIQVTLLCLVVQT